jgi:hypothetical protein
MIAAAPFPSHGRPLVALRFSFLCVLAGLQLAGAALQVTTI